MISLLYNEARVATYLDNDYIPDKVGHDFFYFSDEEILSSELQVLMNDADLTRIIAASARFCSTVKKFLTVTCNTSSFFC